MEWQRFEKPDYGYTIDLPRRWIEQPPDLKNSPLETARFVDPEDRRHSVSVFRSMPAPETTAERLAERAQSALERHSWTEFTVAADTIGSEPGLRLNTVKRDAGRVMALRQYFVARGDVGLILAANTVAAEEDDALLTEISERFGVLLD